MQFEKRFKPGIRDGLITLSFRAWKRPQVKVGGRYRVHPVGMIEVDALGYCRRSDITAAPARTAGFESRKELFDYLDRKSDGSPRLYRVAFHYAGDGEDARPDTSTLADSELEALGARLERMDRLSSRGAWTRETLRSIDKLPAIRAADLARRIGLETQVFKTMIPRVLLGERQLVADVTDIFE